MKKTIAIISYVIFLPCLIIGCMLFYSYMEKFPFVNNPPYGTITFLSLGIMYPIIYFYYHYDNNKKIDKILNAVGFTQSKIQRINHIDGNNIFIDPVRGEFLIIINKKLSAPVVKGYNYNQWMGYDYDGSSSISLKFNDFEFPSFTISVGKNFRDKLDIMRSPSYAPKDERSFYKHVQQSLATA